MKLANSYLKDAVFLEIWNLLSLVWLLLSARYVTTDNKLRNGTLFAQKYLGLQLKMWKISYITTEMQVCLVFIERVYISLQRYGYVPIEVRVIMF